MFKRNSKKSDNRIKDSWLKSDDKIGIKPNFTIRCRFCRSGFGFWIFRLHTKMVVRWSNVLRPVYSNDVFAQDICYKCPKCDFIVVFGVPLPLGYANEIRKRRDGQTHYVPYDIWNDDEEIKKQIESLGYF